jgi:hypothetical protein
VGESGHELGRRRFGLVHAVEEAQRENQLDRVRRRAHLGCGGEAEPGRRGEPRVRGHCVVVAGHLVGVRRGDRGDLQRRPRRRIGPERGAAGGVGQGERERQSALRPGDRQQPVAQGHRVGDRFAGRGQLREHLERVQGRARLAGRRAQIGFQPPAIAAVGVAVGGQRSRDAARLALVQQGEPATVEQPAVGGEEGRGSRDVGAVDDGHDVTFADGHGARREHIGQPHWCADADPSTIREELIKVAAGRR